MYIYIASSLCSESEKEFNLKVNNYIESYGFKTYLPQLHGGILSDLVKQGLDENEIRNISDMVVFIIVDQ